VEKKAKQKKQKQKKKKKKTRSRRSTEERLRSSLTSTIMAGGP
jgi:hypothetical protein